MRSTYGLWGRLEKELRKHLKGVDTTDSLGARQICEVELGLYLLSQIAPAAPARALWVLLTGYEFPLPELQRLSKQQRSMWNIVRHILLHFKNARHWEDMLERYRNVDERLRLYDIDGNYEQFTKRTISIEARREDVIRVQFKRADVGVGANHARIGSTSLIEGQRQWIAARIYRRAGRIERVGRRQAAVVSKRLQ